MWRVVLVVSVWVGIVGCGDPPPSKYPSQEVNVEDTSLGPGDVFEVRVFYGSKELKAMYRVSAEGTIQFPYIGEVVVADKSPAEIELEIQQRLADGYLKSPIVSVFVKESNSKKVSVFGQVREAGTFPYTDGMTIVEAISRAGGFTPMARKNAVTVTRKQSSGEQRFTVPVESIAEGKASNFMLRPGDVVFVPERPY